MFGFSKEAQLKKEILYYLDRQTDFVSSQEIAAEIGNITSQTNYNDYYNFNYSSEVRKECNIYNSNVVLDDVKTTILCTIGSV